MVREGLALLVVGGEVSKQAGVLLGESLQHDPRRRNLGDLRTGMACLNTLASTQDKLSEYSYKRILRK